MGRDPVNDTSTGHTPVTMVLTAIQSLAQDQARCLIGIAGPPGAGKSTLAAQLATALGPAAAVLPMDGYHLDNDALEDMGLLHRKGAPETFDGSAFVQLVRCLRQQGSVTYPTFDRDQDRTVPSGGRISEDTRIVLIEGNYLLLQDAPWSDLKDLFDLTLFLDVPRAVLKSRLVARWREHGLSQDAAEHRAEANDMRNADLVIAASVHADFVVAERAD